MSEQELVEAIKKKLDNPKDSDINSDAFKSLAAVVYKLSTPEGILAELKTKGERALLDAKGNPDKYISTTKYIPAIHVVGKNEFRFTPERNDEERKKRYIEAQKSNPEFGGDVTLIEKAFNDQIAVENEYKKVGTHIHALVHILLTDGVGSAKYKEQLLKLEKDLTEKDHTLAKVLTSEDKSINYTDIAKIQEKLIAEAKSIVTWIDTAWPASERKAVFSEMPMVLENGEGIFLTCKENGVVKDYDGILGTADLIIVDKNNKVHLIDYKVSTRAYPEWYQAKQNEVQYQMGIYRAALTAAGINGDDISITIKPALLPKGKISLLKGGESVDLLSSTGGIPNLAWRGGTFTYQLRKCGIGAQPIFKVNMGTDIHEAINSDYDKIMGFKRDPKIVTKQELIDSKKIEPHKDSKGNIIGYKFWSTFAGPKGGWEIRDTMEEFTKEGGVLDQYIQQLSESRKEIASTLVKEIQKVKSGKLKASQFLQNERNITRKQMLIQRLGKYLNSNWRCLSEEFEQLADYGILVFRQDDSNTGETVLDIVSIAEFPLHERTLINGSQTILGKYYTDSQAQKLDIDAMDSSYRNIKALEAVSILNTLLQKNPDAFESVSIGNLIILNPFGSAEDNTGIDLQRLKENFSLLCSEENANIEDKFKDIKVPNTYEYCMSELSAVLQTLDVDEDLEQLLISINNGADTLALKKARIKNLLQKMRDKYPVDLRNKEFGKHNTWDLNNPVHISYILLAQMNNYLHGIQIDFDGKTSKYGISLGELFSLLGVPFTGKIAMNDTDGSKIVGFAGGMEISSPRTTPSNTLRQLNAYYDVIYSSVRKQFDIQTNYISNLTKKYVKNFTSEASQFFVSDHINIWSRLLVQDGKKIGSRMILKNPYDKSNDLTELDREFLKEWLWEVNKYLLPGVDTTWHYKEHQQEIEQLDALMDAMANNESEYLNLPLARSESFQRLTHLGDYGLSNYFKAKWQDFEETYDPRSLHNERRAQIKKNDITEMYNNYLISPLERNRILESVNGPQDFSLDLDFLALDVAFQAIRKEHFDNALMLTETVTAMMQFQQQQSGADFENELETARTQSKINLTGESTISEETEKIAKPLGIIKQLNSFILLACRPMAFLKELTFGMFTNFSRAWSLKFGSNKLGIKSVSKANAIIWGQQFGKYGKAFTGEGSLADFTMCEAINRLYGIANQDLNHTVRNASLQRIGKFNNMSRWMYIAQSAPDYYNRMTLFIAKMIEDGCFDAHTLDANGVLHYDWKKDKRFDKLAKYGLNTKDVKDTEYHKQKALYAKMCSEFEKGNETLIRWDNEKQMYIYGDLTQAYTADQKASIKEVSDMAYGFYDHESKSQINHKFLGLVFLQFQTFLSAKYNLWFKAPAKRGGNTAQGRFVHMERNGEKYYDKFIADSQGNLIEVIKVPESKLTEEEKMTLQPSMEWQGDFVEGLFYSLGYTIHDIFTLNWKEIVNNKQRLANVGLAMHDFLLGIILVSILKAIFSNGSNKLQDIKPTQRVLVRALEDIGPGAFTNLSITPSFINTLNTLKSDGIKLLFHDSPEAIEQMTKHFGATKDFYWNEN